MFALDKMPSLLSEDQGLCDYNKERHQTNANTSRTSEDGEEKKEGMEVNRSDKDNDDVLTLRKWKEKNSSFLKKSGSNQEVGSNAEQHSQLDKDMNAGEDELSLSNNEPNKSKIENSKVNEKSSSARMSPGTSISATISETSTSMPQSDNGKKNENGSPKKMLNPKEVDTMISRASKSTVINEAIKVGRDADDFISLVEAHYKLVAFSAVCTWVLLIAISFYVGYLTDRLETLTIMERKAPLIACLLVGMTLVSTTLPFLVCRKNLSGVIICAVVVQMIALSTDFLMAFFPTPVFIDPVCGTRCFLLRWCEWTPLAFVMAFLTESCHMDDTANRSGRGLSGSGRSYRGYGRSGEDPAKFSLIIGAVSEQIGVDDNENENDGGEDMDVDEDTHIEDENDIVDDDSDHTNHSIKTGEKIPINQKQKAKEVRGGSIIPRLRRNEARRKKLQSDVQKKLQPAYCLAWSQGLSTLCGWAFPFCPGIISWTILMLISCALFALLFVRLHARMVTFKAMKKGTRPSEQEAYLWAGLSLGLLKTCSCVWSILVFVFFATNLGPILLPDNKFLQTKGLSMVLESSLDVLFKAVYLRIVIDVHDTVFDPSARAERRLEELRQMLNVVWDSSSDVIGISVRGVSGNVTTMLSPTYKKFYYDWESHDSDSDGDLSSSAKKGKDVTKGGMALAFELDPKYFSSNNSSDEGKDTKKRKKKDKKEDIAPSHMYELSFMDLATPGKKTLISTSRSKLSTEEMNSLSKLIVRAWDGSCKRKKSLLMHDLIRAQNIGETKRFNNIRCEISITKIEENALVVVVRDISERVMRFEAEKKVISETTARRKDAAANRFTRHEVKNGLLAAIGLCDSLLETVQTSSHKSTGSGNSSFDNAGSMKLSSSGMSLGPSTDQRARVLDMSNQRNATFNVVPSSTVAGPAASLNSALAASITAELAPLQNMERDNSRLSAKPRLERGDLERCDSDMQRYLYELDKTLHEVLDTILAEAMARDVIHEVYEPKLERINLQKLLNSTMNSTANSISAKRFPVKSTPAVLPDFALDPQLLKYIHRNAISNACKYGKKGGVVSTEVSWNQADGVLSMDVINLPGEKHEQIVKLGALAAEVVFSPRRRLTMHCMVDDNNHVSASHSSGDGAWIMDKCAKTLGGHCTIKFEKDSTRFSFMCPVKLFNDKLIASANYECFELPKDLYAIAIDDSKIQRKLLSRFFAFAGIPSERIHIMGATASEITGFVDWSVNFVDSHPYDLFLFLVDENLDVQDDDHAGTKQKTVSGSAAVAEMRSRLLPDQERKVLSLIRSANDSAKDVAIYNSRAHGYLPKAPIRAESVLEVLAPLWLARFPRFEMMVDEDKKPPAETHIFDDSEVIITMNDLMGCVDDMDSLSQLDKEELEEKWSIVWEKLHALKGDLQIMPGGGLDEAISLITSLRSPKPPRNFAQDWQKIRSSIFAGC